MALLQYDIRVVGAANVDKALAGIEARIRAHNASVAKMTGVTTAQARRASNPAAVASDATRAARSTEQTDRRKVAIQNTSFGMEQRQRAAAARSAEQAERRKANIQNTSFRMEQHHRESEEKARARAAVKEQRLADRTAKARTEFTKATLGRGYERVMGTVKAVGTAGAAMLGVGGAGLAVSSVAGATRLDERARRLIIAGRAPGATEGYTADDVRKQVNNLGIAHGINPEEVIGGEEKYVEKTGNLGDAMKFGDTFATAAQAAGASMTDIASIGAEMSKKFNIKTVEDMQQAFAMLIFQGKKNAFVLKDMAPLLTSVMAGMKGQAGLQGVEGMKTVGGLMQMAKEGTGSPEEASTALENVLKQLVAKADQIQGGDFGDKVQVFEGGDSKNPMRDLLKIIPELVSSVKGDVVKLNDIFEIRGSRAFNPVTGAYRTAYAATKGTTKEKEEAGNEAVKKALATFVDAPGANYAEVKKDEVAAMKSFSVQLEILETQFKEVVASELFPELVKLAPQLKEMIPLVGDLAHRFVELLNVIMSHPFAAVGAVIGAQLTADIANAKLGEVVSDAIKRSMTRAPGSSGNPGSAGSGGGGGGLPSSPIGSSNTPKLVQVAQFVSEVADQGDAMISSAYGGKVGSSISSAQKMAEQLVNGGGDVTAATKGLEDLQSLSAGAGRAKTEAGSVSGELLGDIKRLGVDLFGQGGAQAQHETDKAALAKQDEIVAAIKALQDALSARVAGGSATPNRGNTPSPIKG